MKIAALDVGDTWTGIAISDPLGITARPYTTIKTDELIPFLTTFFKEERIKKIIVGLPTTMKGTDSTQTTKVRDFFITLKSTFALFEWQLWDERLSSKRADSLRKKPTKENKNKSHAIAAAFILSSYLLSTTITESI